MKTITFTVLKEELLLGKKTQTFRTLFIPTYEINEMVGLTFKEDGKKEYLYNVFITDLYPKQIKNLTLEEAKRDGFNTISDFKKTVMDLNKIKSENQWGFIIRWTKCKQVIK